ncbi:hypothetical protein Ctob_014865 [Chrysochromulina tobinii]|uniref:Uncharacterized protein n=1 Tax=Chrysochromulina tobinii TaxID=1460289 RepID=A0A0M0JTK3_9EUKA|nr:hypothetical protein Ctob_014865 [Chrysochromulina tobinii]|eukprot:KOO29914.1 hypothetical protein Ctob_014865 [Chrysochromulina sp. CCMP291]
MAHALARGDPAKKEAIQHFCDRVQANLCARAVFDIGGLQRMSRNNMLQLLVSIEKDTEHWVDSIEDVLNFSFPTPVITESKVGRDPAQPPASAALVPKSVGSRPGGLRTSKYLAEKGKLGLGARLLSKGELDGVVFSLTMFPKLETSNPAVETITEPDVSHILDTVFEMTFTKYGEVHVDKTYRVHCGQKLRLLFPNYGVVSLACANASWIKFYDIEDIFKETKRHISEEKHKLHQKDYYDSWMLVKKVLVEEAAGAEEAAPTAI